MGQLGEKVMDDMSAIAAGEGEVVFVEASLLYNFEGPRTIYILAESLVCSPPWTLP